jgi:hypothetical protein
MFVAIGLLLVSVIGIYLLLRNMGKDGVEAAAPGSCRSGRCGVQPGTTTADSPPMAQSQVIRIDEIKRKDALSNNQTL